LALIIVASTFVVASTTRASYTNVLSNGSFEHGFSSQAGCGMVGSGWHCFTNGGAAVYGFYDDQWERTRFDGNHSQLIEINTKGIQNADHDRYAGIYQTVRVVDWANYTLSLRGLIRTTLLDGDPWRYRVQVGWSAGPHASWGAVTNWTDVGWDTYYARTEPGAFLSYATNIMAEDDYLTIYLRVWKKWGVAEEEIDINFDAITLTGPAPGGHYWPQKPVHPKAYEPPAAPPAHPSGPVTLPAHPPQYGACAVQELIYNGNFEHGFIPVTVGHVGRSWGYFTNGGAANYGFYDEQWPPVVTDGKHGQLIEINTKGVLPADPDRYAGIYQRITGLHPGQTYEFSLRGQLRGAGNEDDPYRFAAQWGYNLGGDTDWSRVTNWQEMDLGPIHVRTEPGPMATYSTRFVATSSEIVLFIRGWKKWGISEVEMDFNLDSISLRGCTKPAPPVVQPPAPQPPVACSPCEPPPPPPPPSTGCSPCEPPPSACSYTVQAGDSLSWIAQNHGVSMQVLMKLNGIHNPNLIFIGQTLTLPGCGGPVGHYPQPKPAPVARHTHVIKPGETFSHICELYGTDPYALAEINGITNWDLVYVGQVLTIP
jgi:LysM repeat protein